MLQLPKRVEYFILCLSLCLGVLSTALASPLYPIYADHWGINTTQIGYAFVAYMLGVVFSLLFFNQATHKYGFKKVVCVGLGMCIAALIYSALSSNIYHLCTSRFLIGISSGLLSTSTVIGLNLKYPFSKPALAGKITSVITVFGFSLGPLIGGLIADHSTSPLTMPYYVIVTISCFVFVACFFIHYQHTKPSSHTTTKVWNIPQHSEYKLLFFVCSVAALCSFAVFSLYAALSGTFLSTLPLAQSATLTGLSISIILFISTLTQFFLKGLKESLSLASGLISLLLGCILLISSQILQQQYLLLCSVLIIGLGHGLTLNPAYYFITKMTQLENPAIFSTFLLIAYQGTIWPILVSSTLIDQFSIPVALSIFSFIIFIATIWIFKHLKILKAQ